LPAMPSWTSRLTDGRCFGQYLMALSSKLPSVVTTLAIGPDAPLVAPGRCDSTRAVRRNRRPLAKFADHAPGQLGGFVSSSVNRRRIHAAEINRFSPTHQPPGLPAQGPKVLPRSVGRDMALFNISTRCRIMSGRPEFV
jgi:hypothetical protein